MPFAHNYLKYSLDFLRQKTETENKNKRETEQLQENQRESGVYIKKNPKKALTSFGSWCIICLALSGIRKISPDENKFTEE